MTHQRPDWKSAINTELPVWDPYGDLLGRLVTPAFPDAETLNRLLPPGACSGGGAPLRFVPASRVPGASYERRIFETGEVCTREGSWHDLFNALVWCRLPRLKAAMNALHYSRLEVERDGRRGPVRDALTLLDESGGIVLSGDQTVLKALAQRDWLNAMWKHSNTWGTVARVVVCGHGLLEKFLRPYKSVTAHALLCHFELPASESISDHPLAAVDVALSRLLLDGAVLISTASLSPLPLMGLRGWWRGGDQDRAFYEDRGVFRAPPVDFRPAPIFSL